jgi:PAS domain S-box-containing protein
MSKKKRAPRPAGSGRDAAFWSALADYNELPARDRAAALARLGFRVTDPDVLGILTKSHFVIPGVTRWACQRCGECCRYARKVAQLTYEPCPFLTEDRSCSKHDDRYLICEWFPFWVFNDPVHGPLLTIKPYCTGCGCGEPVEYQATVERIQRLAASGARAADGAFVIHEVLLIPGTRDWVFPSRTNIDTLMECIRGAARLVANGVASQPGGHLDEVHYAHHTTSGLLGSINAALCTIDERGAITDANEAACRLGRVDREMLVGQPFQSLFVNPERVAVAVTACFSRGKELASPQRLRLPDGTTLPVLLDAITYRDRGDGLVHAALVCVNPVPAAVFTEVGQSREYARGLIEASLDALMVIDKDGVIIDVNDALATLSGRAREGGALLGAPFADLFSDGPAAWRGVAATFECGQVRNYQLTLVAVSGEAIPVSFNATVYRDVDGVVRGVFAAARDIRERQRMMDELEEARRYSRGLIECCLDLMVTIDRAGVVTDANQAAVEITGRDLAKLVGSPFRSFFADPGRADAGVASVFAEGAVRDYRLDLVDAAGRRVPVAFNATLYRDANGVVQGVFAIARAIG